MRRERSGRDREREPGYRRYSSDDRYRSRESRGRELRGRDSRGREEWQERPRREPTYRQQPQQDRYVAEVLENRTYIFPSSSHKVGEKREFEETTQEPRKMETRQV